MARVGICVEREKLLHGPTHISIQSNMGRSNLEHTLNWVKGDHETASCDSVVGDKSDEHVLLRAGKTGRNISAQGTQQRGVFCVACRSKWHFYFQGPASQHCIACLFSWAKDTRDSVVFSEKKNANIGKFQRSYRLETVNCQQCNSASLPDENPGLQQKQRAQTAQRGTNIHLHHWKVKFLDSLAFCLHVAIHSLCRQQHQSEKIETNCKLETEDLLFVIFDRIIFGVEVLMWRGLCRAIMLVDAATRRSAWNTEQNPRQWSTEVLLLELKSSTESTHLLP